MIFLHNQNQYYISRGPKVIKFSKNREPTIQIKGKTQKLEIYRYLTVKNHYKLTFIVDFIQNNTLVFAYKLKFVNIYKSASC